MLSRVCWAPYPISRELEFSYTKTKNIHKGVWAGHAFDITTVGRHEEEVKLKGGEAEWKDSSEEVSREVAVSWECKYGEDWREKICQLDHLQWEDFDAWKLERGELDSQMGLTWHGGTTSRRKHL